MPADVRFAFDRFELDPVRRRLTAAGEPVAMSDRQFDVLLLLVSRAGQIISKDDLLQAGWKDVAVGDNSIEQAISSLRRLLGRSPGSVAFIETVPRRGYRFGSAVSRTAPRESDAGLDALLAPHRAFIEGRAALETLEGDRVARARHVFEGALHSAPEYAAAHIGLANACVMQFEMTRADPASDLAALAVATDHAREACRLEPQSGEAWATLGFVLDRTGHVVDARAASQRAVTLEPDNWRHHFRLSVVSWGEERLRAAHRTLTLLPGFPLAHWLAATVHVARQVLSEAERELAAGLAPEAGGPPGSRFNAVALHWLLGLIHLAHGDETLALEEFERELSFEHAGQLYARECAANTWYAIGALRLRQGRPADAHAAFARAIERVAAHPMAHAGLAAAHSLDLAAADTGENRSARVFTTPDRSATALAERIGRPPTVDAAMFRAVPLVATGAHSEAACLLDEALTGAPAGNAGWLLPIEPLLNVAARPDNWARVLAHLRNRAT
jgi:DNA-binding winged helix-turn-helix (wHTH) protein/Tfp pilus assembly protein PilF